MTQLVSKGTDRIRTVTYDTFDALIAGEKGPLALEFMSYGCAHCRALEPILQEVAERVSSSVGIFRVNIGIDRELATDFDIEGTPTLVMIENGMEVNRVEGPHPTVSTLLAAITHSFGR
jgi:thioredoxin 1